MFVNRETELAFLGAIQERKHPSAAQFILLYGRRRVGKTVLLRQHPGCWRPCQTRGRAGRYTTPFLPELVLLKPPRPRLTGARSRWSI
jgi:hypothetical protein